MCLVGGISYGAEGGIEAATSARVVATTGLQRILCKEHVRTVNELLKHLCVSGAVFFKTNILEYSNALLCCIFRSLWTVVSFTYRCCRP